MKLRGYAKINLTLDITGRREDGFHTLDTVMQSVSLYDEVELLPAREPGIHVRCSRDYLPVDMKNTAFRAVWYFWERFGIENEGISISIRKRVPSRAGMGGGSADAAAVLRGMDRLYETRLSVEELMEIGLKVGADVPFCIRGGTCRCTGIGEILQPVAPLPDCHLVICKPPAGMSTPRAYALIDRYPLARSQGTAAMVEALETGDLRRAAALVSNRFDEVMKLMQVREIKRVMLGAGALGSMMTGSGSAVYGIFSTQQAAENCRQLLEGKGKVYLARPVRNGAE